MSITRTKEKLAEAISIYERLSQNIKNEPFISSLNDEDWAKHLRTLGHDAVRRFSCKINKNQFKFLFIF
jgi:hypothetical protein